MLDLNISGQPVDGSRDRSVDRDAKYELESIQESRITKLAKSMDSPPTFSSDSSAQYPPMETTGPEKNLTY